MFSSGSTPYGRPKLIGQMFNLHNRLRGNHLTNFGIETKPVAASHRLLGGHV